VGELGEAEPATTVGAGVGVDGEPDGGVGGRAGLAPGGGDGDGDGSVEERASGVAFAPGAAEAEEHPVGVPGGGGEAGVAGQLGGEAVEGLAAVVVLDEERQGNAVLGPDAVAVGADVWVPKTRSLRTDSGQGSSSATLVSVSHIAQKELRNHIGEVLRRAEAGETLTVTVAGRPVAELGPAHRRRWVSGATLAGIWRAKAPRGLDADLERLPAGVVDPFAS
jgi:prevent-host-death family protein